jgi:hypothetical protein
MIPFADPILAPGVLAGGHGSSPLEPGVEGAGGGGGAVPRGYNCPWTTAEALTAAGIAAPCTAQVQLCGMGLPGAYNKCDNRAMYPYMAT